MPNQIYNATLTFLRDKLLASTFPITPLYIHVEKDFQSHHTQIYSSTLMGGQERERKCVRNA